MRPQNRNQVLSGRCFRRATSHRQKLWQGILILATLALAMAAHASGFECRAVFGAQNEIFKPNSTVTIRYRFSENRTDLLSNEAIRGEIVAAADRELIQIQAKISELETELATIDSRFSKLRYSEGDRQFQKADKIGEIATANEDLARVSRIRDIAVRGGRLTMADRRLISQQVFTERMVYRGKRDQALLTERIAQLNERAMIRNSLDVPKKWPQKLMGLMSRHKLTTFVVIASLLSSGGYEIVSLYQQHQAAEQNLTTVLIYE